MAAEQCEPRCVVPVPAEHGRANVSKNKTPTTVQRLALVIGGLCVGLLICEAILRATHRSQGFSALIEARLSSGPRLTFEGPLHRPDATLGYMTLPGASRIQI